MRSCVGREALIDLLDEYRSCSRCSLLTQSRTQVVFGGGNSKAPLLVVGEAPGVAEDATGIPFWGESGRLLMWMLADAWPPGNERLARIRADGASQHDDDYFEVLRDFLEDYVFWTNLVLCHPAENRDPQRAEVKECSDRLNRTIYAVDPQLIIATGKIAVNALLKQGREVAITDSKVHGRIFDIWIPSPVTGERVRYPMLALLHPAYLLRKGDLSLVKSKKGETYATIEDLREALRLLVGLETELNTPRLLLEDRR